MKNEIKKILDILDCVIFEQSFCSMSGQSWYVERRKELNEIRARLDNKVVKKPSHNKKSPPFKPCVWCLCERCDTVQAASNEFCINCGIWF